jgi:preprotein translocase subunit SecD
VKGTRGLWASIIFVGVLTVASLVGLLSGALQPTLGLDLEGGVSVILSAPSGTPDDVMDRALESIRNRVDSFGVGEPQIYVSGTNIEVQLPGLAKGTIDERSKQQFCLLGADGTNFGCLKDEAAAKSTLDGVKAEEQVQQVCLRSDALDVKDVCYGTQDDADAAVAATTVGRENPDGTGDWCVQDGDTSYGCFPTKKAAQAAKDGLTTQATSRFCITGADVASAVCFPDEAAANDAIAGIEIAERNREFCVVSSADVNLGCFIDRTDAERKLQETGQERLLSLIGTTARLEQREVLEVLTPQDPNFDSQPLTCDRDPSTATADCPSSPDELADTDVWFLGQDDGAKYHLGPVEITGDAIRKATAQYATPTSGSSEVGWRIQFEATNAGRDTIAEVTTRLQGKQLAIILDGSVISAPVVQNPITDGVGVITGNFTKESAQDLATVLNAGALPVQLETQQVLTVSPTLGKESLHQGIVAGVVGLVLLFLYLLFYYRLLGVVAWFGMSIWAILALALVSIAGATFGYALTLAGVAGLVISLGVTADSYIVFFERLKDEVRGGRSARSAVQPAFKRAYKTIVAADIVTGIAAVVLYLTAVSSVRGFALTLGVATLLDLFVVWFFKRPTVFLIARNRRLVSMPGFGLESGVAADHEGAPVPVAGGSR